MLHQMGHQLNDWGHQHFPHKPRDQQPQDQQQQAGASWSPPHVPYDVNAGPWTVCYSDEDKQRQREAGKWLAQEVKDAIEQKRAMLEVPRGVYRITDEPLMIIDSVGLTIRAPGVELIAEVDNNHARVLGNTDLVMEGAPGDPLIFESDPVGFAQGWVLGADKEACTIDLQLMDGYELADALGRIELFTPQGVMLPHPQDVPQEHTDLGDRKWRLKMNPFTFAACLPEGLDKFAAGNLIALETHGRGGPEMRNNHNVRFTDVMCCCSCLFWAMPETGDDVYERRALPHALQRVWRFRSCRRPGTNRLVGGGWPLQTFSGGSYTAINCEISHNMDDVTDINTPCSFAFGQRDPRTMLLLERDILPPGTELLFYSYPELEEIGRARVAHMEPDAEKSEQKAWEELAEKMGVRPLNEPHVLTIDSDVHIGCPSGVAMVHTHRHCRKMSLIGCHLHDGLAGGGQLKGADEVLIQNCIVERTNLMGIAVGLDTFWWEGSPSANISILNNTVLNCCYQPGCQSPAISVYAGEEKLAATGHVQHKVTIAGNLVQGQLGAAIHVTNSSDVTIRDNVIVHTPEHDAGHAAIWVDAVTEGTVISGNTFVGFPNDCWQLPVSTGPRTQAGALRVQGNHMQDPHGPVPDRAWQLVDRRHPDVRLSEGWTIEGDDRWPQDHSWAHDGGCTAEVSFEGCQVAVLGERGPMIGLANVFLDDQQVAADVDWSRNYKQECVLFKSEPLPDGRYTLRVECCGRGGAFSVNQCVSIHCFMVLAHVPAQQNGFCVV